MSYKFLMEICAIVKLTVHIDGECFRNIPMIWEQKKRMRVICPIIIQGKWFLVGIKVKVRG